MQSIKTLKSQGIKIFEIHCGAGIEGSSFRTGVSKHFRSVIHRKAAWGGEEKAARTKLFD